MSTTAAARRLAAAQPVASPRSRFSVITTPQRSGPSVAYFLLCGAVLLAALVGSLLLNTAMAVASHRIHAQEAQLTLLSETQADLTAQLESLGSPTVLRDRADALGMVPAGTMVFLSLESGTVVGAPAVGEQ